MADIRDLLTPPDGRGRPRRARRPDWRKAAAYGARSRPAPTALLAWAALAGVAVGLWPGAFGDRRAPGTSAESWDEAQRQEDARARERERYRAEMEAQEGAPPASAPDDGQGVGSGGTVHAGPVRVVDGDTFWAGPTKIRIADIDTPEVRGRCPAETALAARATRRLRGLLAAGPFTLEPVDRDEDRYGRKLRVVTRGGASLGDVLVSEGLARRYDGGRRSWC